MNKTTLQGSSGPITDYEVLTTALIIKKGDNGMYSTKIGPAAIGVSQCESMPEMPVLSVALEDGTIILEFNSDFPLLFKEAIKLWK